MEEFKCNPEVFERIYEHYYEMILRYLMKRTMSAELAYDLTADTFVKAYEGIHKFKWQGISIKVWLYRIAINSLKNNWRKKESLVLTEEMENNAGLVKDVQEELDELDKKLFGDDDLSKLSDAMATLKDKHQNVISLYYFSGMSQREIAETMGKSVSAVKAIMNRAMNNLKQLMV